jgi:hypothetical protein
LPKAKPESNQGTGDSGIQRSGKKRTGALRAVAMREGDDPMLQIARQTVKFFDESMGIDKLVDHFHHLRRGQNGNTDDWKRADIITRLNVAIAEKRTGAV